MWTLAELAALAAQALADAQVRAANGRVTGMPDGRLIRWYTTIGLLDRPAIGPGRVARYGPRHLLQLVAIKRLQAQGMPLAEIQQRLAGATDDQLRQAAALPEGFAPATLDPAAGDAVPGPLGAVANSPSAQRAGRFWRERPIAAGEPGDRQSHDGPHQLDSGGDTVTRMYGLRLRGLTLLLSAEPSARDLEAIASAARPLLDLLAARGLIRTDTDHADPLNPTEGTRS
jgi:DNA-binding transcriptional MerR regulator